FRLRAGAAAQGGDAGHRVVLRRHHRGRNRGLADRVGRAQADAREKAPLRAGVVAARPHACATSANTASTPVYISSAGRPPSGAISAADENPSSGNSPSARLMKATSWSAMPYRPWPRPAQLT